MFLVGLKDLDILDVLVVLMFILVKFGSNTSVTSVPTKGMYDT